MIKCYRDAEECQVCRYEVDGICYYCYQDAKGREFVAACACAILFIAVGVAGYLSVAWLLK